MPVGVYPRTITEAYREAHRKPLEDLGYSGVHLRVRRALPAVCLHCGTTQGQIDAALLHGRGSKTDRRGVFSTALADYIRLCSSCHKVYDKIVDNFKKEN